ncbi:MAG: hypothetical protein ACRDSN_10375, partial [Pseudonocardiaceae bacterium]
MLRVLLVPREGLFGHPGDRLGQRLGIGWTVGWADVASADRSRRRLAGPFGSRCADRSGRRLAGRLGGLIRTTAGLRGRRPSGPALSEHSEGADGEGDPGG